MRMEVSLFENAIVLEMRAQILLSLAARDRNATRIGPVKSPNPAALRLCCPYRSRRAQLKRKTPPQTKFLAPHTLG